MFEQGSQEFNSELKRWSSIFMTAKAALALARVVVLRREPEIHPLTPEQYAALKPDLDAADEQLARGETTPISEVLRSMRQNRHDN